MNSVNLNSRVVQWLTLFVLAFIWGTSFILMKKGLLSYSNQQVAAFRVFFSFIFILPYSLKHRRKLNHSNVFSILIVGVIGIAIPAILFTKAQTRIESATAGILNSFTPLSTLLIGVLFYKARIRLIHLIGICIGFTGAFGLIIQSPDDLIGSLNYYAFFVLLATMCYGINVNEVKNNLSQLKGIEITSLAFLLIGPLAGLYLLFSDFSEAVKTQDYLTNLLYIAILALFSSVIAIVIFNTLIKYTTGIFAASVTYIIPIFAVFWGILDGENIQVMDFVWILIILTGVYLVNKKRKHKK